MVSHNDAPAAPCIIQLDGMDLNYEWHVASNTMFLSRGLREKLHLGDSPVMARDEFTSHIPAENMTSMTAMLEELLTGNEMSMLELFLPFDDKIVKSHLVVVQREKTGYARLILGNVSIQQELAYHPSIGRNDSRLRDGYLRYDCAKRRICLDASCAAMLGYENSGPLQMSTKEFRALMDPEDEDSIIKRSLLLLEHNQWGDQLRQEVHLRKQDGSFSRFALIVSVLGRDAQRHATDVVGSMHLLDENMTDTCHTGSGKLFQAISAAGDGVCEWDAVANRVSYSSRYLSMLGYTAEEFPPELASWSEKIHPDDRERIVSQQLAVISSPQFGDSFECFYRMLRADGIYAWILGRGYVTHRGEDGRATRVVGLHTDISNPQHDRAQLEEEVNSDMLTGLRSRWYLTSETRRIEQARVRPVSVIVFDLDGLKLVNDYLGHDQGDRLLKEFAALLRESFRASDCLARVGGDEFTVLLHDCSREEAQDILERLKERVAEYNRRSDVIPIHVSIGTSTTDSLDVSLLDTIVAADMQMLQLKHHRREEILQAIKTYIESHSRGSVFIDSERYTDILPAK